MILNFQNRTGVIITLRSSNSKKSEDFVADLDAVNFKPSDEIYEFPCNKRYLVIRVFGTNQPGIDTVGCIIPCPVNKEFTAVIGYATPNGNIILNGVEYGYGSQIKVPKDINTLAIGMGKYELQYDGKAKAITNPTYFRARTINSADDGYEAELTSVQNIRVFMGTQTELSRKDIIQLYITIFIIIILCIAIVVITIVEKNRLDGGDSEDL